MTSDTHALGWSRWVRHTAWLKPLGLVLLASVLGTGAWLAGQVVVLDHTSALVLDSNLAQVSGPLRPEAPIQLSLQGAGTELRDAQLFRSDQPMPVQLVPEASRGWRVVAPDGSSPLATDGDYRLVVRVVGPRPALPTPRLDLLERQYRFSTVASPRPDLPSSVVHPRWAEPVSFTWSLPMRSVKAGVDPPAPMRVWIDDTDARRTWVQLGGDLASGQTYRVQVTEGVSTDGLQLRQPGTFTIGVPSQPMFLDAPTEPVTLQYGDSLTLEASTELTDAHIEISDGAPARTTVQGKQVTIDMPDFEQGADFDVTVTSAISPEGAPLDQPLTVHVHTPDALAAPTIEPADGAQNVLPIQHPSITFPEPVADPEAATQALDIQPPVPGTWEWPSPDKAVFVPSVRLPVLTTFRISVKGGPDGPRTAEGGFLDDDVVATFRTAHDKRIDVSLGQQRLQMIQDGQVLRTVAVATGVAAAPTPPGTFYVQYKSPQMRFRGVNPDGSHYDIPDVNWVMPFFGDYTLHGAYWRPRFGVPGSDGCVSMTDGDAKTLYDWADVGTPVIIHS